MKNITLHVISHTHWDREWYLNSPFANEWLPPFFQSLFELMENDPNYRFVLDGQASMVEDWLDEMKTVDGIILGTPVYFAGLSGQVKCFMDRTGMVGRANGNSPLKV